MSSTAESFPPLAFLSALREAAPQFAEQSRQTGQYAQQDAQEAWGAIVQAVKQAGGGGGAGEKFVKEYLTGELEKKFVACPFLSSYPCRKGADALGSGARYRLKSAEAPDEEATTSKEQFLELKANISMTTNYMMQGISEVRPASLTSPLFPFSAPQLTSPC